MHMLGIEEAQRLVSDAIAKARAACGRPVCVAVCDAQGFLVAFARADGAPVRSIAISQGKAYSAARMGVSTEAFLERLHREKIEASYFCDERLTALPGGAAIGDTSGRVLGGIGISGLTSAEDQIVASAVAAAAAARRGA
jgi:glc operon protein GlcG